MSTWVLILVLGTNMTAIPNFPTEEACQKEARRLQSNDGWGTDSWPAALGVTCIEQHTSPSQP